MSMEPVPENIAGEVIHRHAFEHRVDWGHIALAAAAIVIVVTVSGSDGASTGGSDAESGL